jgi:hypothetical protein
MSVRHKIRESIGRLLSVERSDTAYRLDFSIHAVLAIGTRVDDRWQVERLFSDLGCTDRIFLARSHPKSYPKQRRLKSHCSGRPQIDT